MKKITEMKLLKQIFYFKPQNLVYNLDLWSAVGLTNFLLQILNQPIMLWTKKK